MSTASRDCGMACGGDRNAVFIPGSSGKPRGYYDPRAERQLGGPVPGISIPGLPDQVSGPRCPKPPECGFQPKCEPEAKIAAKAWARIAPSAGRHDRHSASARAHATLLSRPLA